MKLPFSKPITFGSSDYDWRALIALLASAIVAGCEVVLANAGHLPPKTLTITVSLMAAVSFITTLLAAQGKPVVREPEPPSSESSP